MCLETAAVHGGELGPEEQGRFEVLVCDLPDDYPHDLHWDQRDNVLWKEG